MGKSFFRRKLIAAIWVSVLLSLFLPMDQTRAEEKTVKVGYIDYAGFIEKSQDGTYRGYGVEYLNRVAEYTKWNYQYEKDTWENCLEKLKSGEIDLLCSAQYTDARAAYMDYSKYAIGKESTIIYAKLENDKIYYDDYDEMNGKKIAFLQESYQTENFESFAKMHGLSYTPLYYGSETEMMNAVKEGDADLVVAGSLDLHTDLKVVGKFNVQPFYFTTTKGNEEIMSQIDLALEDINAFSPYYEEELYNKYYGGGAAATTPLFTRQEANYIRNCKPIVVGLLEDASPITSYDQETGGMSGMSEDILRLIAEKSGLQFQYKGISGEEIETLKADGCDLIGCIVKTQQMAVDAQVRFSNEYITSTFAVAGRSGNQYARETGIRIAVNRSLKYAENYIMDNYPNAAIRYYDTNKECANAVLRGEQDIILQNIHILSELLRKPRYESLKMVPVLSMKEPIALMGDTDTDPVLISIIDKTIEVLDEEELNQIVINHTVASQNSLKWYDFLYKYRFAFSLGIVLVIAIITFTIAVTAIHQKNMQCLKVKNEQLLEAIQQAEHANEAKSLFLSRVSHEIRTPMNAIIGINSLIKKHLEEPKRIESYVNKIALSSNLLLNLINDVLDMSAIDQQKLKIAMLPFDLKKVIESIVSMYTPICRNKDIDFHIIYDEEIRGFIIGDQLRVNQVILNLLSNAVKFTPTGGTVSLNIAKLWIRGDREFIRFELIDNGIGIEQEQLDHLFEPFEQEDGSTARHFGGSGLGLSITKNLVELMKGAIHVESEKGSGSTFTVELPFKMAMEEEIPEEKSEVVEEESYDFTGYRILLADDNELNQEIAVELLKNVGATVDTASNGRDAVNKFVSSKPGTYKVILMDVQMPIMDGYEATAQIRHSSHPQRNSIPILAMTANAFTEDVSAAMAAGMDTHIAKPIDTDILYKTIEAYLKDDDDD
ncbi:MAG: transporter substrate-binding domain-containing protein [Lachnospiraceae bacterium]|nr:transporter substrate-binding domain-containing protein [Lachnospiraceae bacterium]